MVRARTTSGGESKDSSRKRKPIDGEDSDLDADPLEERAVKDDGDEQTLTTGIDETVSTTSSCYSSCNPDGFLIRFLLLDPSLLKPPYGKLLTTISVCSIRPGSISTIFFFRSFLMALIMEGIP
jgi:hypothetical protein